MSLVYEREVAASSARLTHSPVPQPVVPQVYVKSGRAEFTVMLLVKTLSGRSYNMTVHLERGGFLIHCYSDGI